MSHDDPVLLQFDEPDGARRLFLEDDARVAYAYLMVDGRITQHVWLYNVSEPPELPDFDDPDRMPFLNPRIWIRPGIEVPRIGECSPRAVWKDDAVELWFDDTLVAELRAGESPGRSLLARVAGPAAIPLRTNPAD